MGKAKTKDKRKGNEINSFPTRSADYSLPLKELSCLTRKNGLVVGTNAVLRLLQKKSLAVVFCFKIASSPLCHSLLLWCQLTDAELINLKENDKYILGPNFPKSVTYGIQKKSLDSLPSISSFLEKIKTLKRTKTQSIEFNQAKMCLDIDEEKMPAVSYQDKAEQEITEIGTLDQSLSFHHKLHVSKKIPSFRKCDLLDVTQVEFPQYEMPSNSVTASSKIRNKKKIKKY